ncbi:DUF3945 domain-containing protein [Pontibacter litorisediminis]|uniref:DUF3945 domain-containing protein n=1 Tax=Pontibacter litorisediminis TaxID=1846260 RepID=UPI0023EBA52B|nr:DUF3945 domain-containing protein [Pontibacter litorisediminis]
MNIDIKELPYAQFEKLGLGKKEVLTMKPEDLARLLSGNRTGLQRLQVGEFDIKAKLSLQRNPDGSLAVYVHPVRGQVKNDLRLSDQEVDRLKQGRVLMREYAGRDGKNEHYYFQLDRETNEILRARAKELVVPSAIKDVVLSHDQKELLRQGRAIELESRRGGLLRARIDLNQPSGIISIPASGQAIQTTPEQRKHSGPKR